MTEKMSEKMDLLERISKNPAFVLVVVAMVFGYGVRQIYADLKERNEVLVTIIREQIEESRSVASSLRSLSERLDSASRTHEKEVDSRR